MAVHVTPVIDLDPADFDMSWTAPKVAPPPAAPAFGGAATAAPAVGTPVFPHRPAAAPPPTAEIPQMLSYTAAVTPAFATLQDTMAAEWDAKSHLFCAVSSQTPTCQAVQAYKVLGQRRLLPMANDTAVMVYGGLRVTEDDLYMPNPVDMCRLTHINIRGTSLPSWMWTPAVIYAVGCGTIAVRGVPGVSPPVFDNRVILSYKSSSIGILTPEAVMYAAMMLNPESEDPTVPQTAFWLTAALEQTPAKSLAYFFDALKKKPK